MLQLIQNVNSFRRCAKTCSDPPLLEAVLFRRSTYKPWSSGRQGNASHIRKMTITDKTFVYTFSKRGKVSFPENEAPSGLQHSRSFFLSILATLWPRLLLPLIPLLSLSPGSNTLTTITATAAVTAISVPIRVKRVSLQVSKQIKCLPELKCKECRQLKNFRSRNILTLVDAKITYLRSKKNCLQAVIRCPFDNKNYILFVGNGIDDNTAISTEFFIERVVKCSRKKRLVYLLFKTRVKDGSSKRRPLLKVLFHVCQLPEQQSAPRGHHDVNDNDCGSGARG